MRTLRTILAFLTGLWCVAAAADDPPKVAVQFVIEASRYRTNLERAGGAEAIARVERQLGVVVADELRSPFRFLQWVSGETTSSMLKARLTSRQAGGDLEFRIVLQGVIDGVALASPPEALLFPWYEPPVTDNPDLVITSLTSRLKTVLADSTLQSQLKAHFTSNVPLVGSVMVRPAERQVIVPLNPAKMQTAENSILQVRFVAAGKNGIMTLNPAILSDTSLGCRVVRIAYPPIDEPGFHPQTPTVLSDVSVTMAEYFYRAYVGTRGTRVTTP